MEEMSSNGESVNDYLALEQISNAAKKGSPNDKIESLAPLKSNATPSSKYSKDDVYIDPLNDRCLPAKTTKSVNSVDMSRVST